MPIDDDVTGKVVILTGASRGIGRGLALHLARRGARLVVTGRKPERLEAVAAELDAVGAEHLAVVSNVADRDGCLALAGATLDHFGRIDGLVANAQTFRSVTPLEEVTEADMDLLLDTGPKGTLWLMQAVFPHMRDQGWGRIVTMGSNGALNGAGRLRALRRFQGGDPGPDACGRPGVGPPRHRRELRVPGVGRPPHPAHRRPEAGRDLRGHVLRRSPSPVTETPRTTSPPSSPSCSPTPAAT